MIDKQELLHETYMRHKTQSRIHNRAISEQLDPHQITRIEQEIWPEITQQEKTEIQPASLTNFKHELNDLAKSIAGYYLIPPEAVLLMLINCISAASLIRFRWQYANDEQKRPVSTYVSIALRSGDNKSDAFSTVFSSLNNAVALVNSKRALQTEVLKRKKANLEKDKKDVKNDKHAAETIDREIIEIDKEIQQNKQLIPGVTDVSAQGLGLIAQQNDGIVWLYSDEIELVEMVFGSQPGAMKSYEILKKGYDGGWVVVMRTTGNLEGKARFAGRTFATFATIAQENLHDLMFQNATENSGILQRFLYYSNFQERMTTKEEFMNAPQINKKLMERFKKTIENIVNNRSPEQYHHTLAHTNDVQTRLRELWFDGKMHNPEDSDFINSYKRKTSGHIANIAAALHIYDNWKDGGKKENKINIETINQAKWIFDKLLPETVKASKSSSEDTLEQQKKIAMEKIKIKMIAEAKAQRKSWDRSWQIYNVKKIRDAVHRAKEFKKFSGKKRGDGTLTEYIRNTLLKSLEIDEWLYFHEESETAIISPRVMSYIFNDDE